jgi:hypothetical protein
VSTINRTYVMELASSQTMPRGASKAGKNRSIIILPDKL